jgi:nucleoside-diphosphate-sugar epimerase
MRITIFGGTGPTGRLLVEQALAADHDVIAYARSPDKLPRHERLQVVQGQLDDAAGIADAVRGSNAVLSVLGPSTDAKQSPPLVRGTGHIVSAMHTHGPRRLVVVATPSAPDPGDGRDWRISALRTAIKLGSRVTYDAIRAIAQTARDSNLDWTIVRVPLLTNGPESHATVRRIGEGGTLKLSRQAMARFLLAQASDHTWKHKAPLITNPS